ncbi:MAG TPA: hypothetical protein VFE37_16040 [Chloroflexota bacterium]|nr:hypothetical protein [Chloroflexota bacterium]
MHRPLLSPDTGRTLVVGLLTLVLAGIWPTAARAQDGGPLDDPQGAVSRALREVGISPSSFDPRVANILAHADDLVYITVRDHPEGLLAADLFREPLRELVDAAAHGDQVLGGWTREQLRAVAERARNANWGTDPGGVALANRLQADDALSLGIYAASLSSSLNSTARDARYYSLPGACLEYHTAITASPGSYNNCLEYLLR